MPFSVLANQVFIPDEEGNLSPIISSLDPPPLPSSDMGMALIKMLVVFLALIVLLFGTYWFLKRLIRNRLQRGVGNPAIRILEKKMISPKTMLYLVEVDHRKILFAESHLDVRRLDTFPPDAPLGSQEH